MKKYMKFMLLVILMIMLPLAISGCGGVPGIGGGEFDGVWVLDRGIISIELRGNSFAITQNVNIVWSPTLGWRVSPASGVVLMGSSLQRIPDMDALADSLGEGIHTITSRGTFSVSDGQIELVFSDGHIYVGNFSSTANTINIGGRQFNRN